jgi:hypothetical protein
MVGLNMQRQKLTLKKERLLCATWSAYLYRCSEDIRIQALVIAKLKLIDIEIRGFPKEVKSCNRAWPLASEPYAEINAAFTRRTLIFLASFSI